MLKDESLKADITAVAKAANVSPATVSRAFNHPDLVKAPTRRRIEAAVERLGYIRNRAARTMHGRRSGTVGMIVPTMTNSIFSEVMQAVSDEVDAAGFTLLVATHGYDLKREVGFVRKFLEHRIDGLALIGLNHEEAVHTLIEKQRIAAVSIWHYEPDSRLSCVGADNERAGYCAASHLISLGHRRIGLAFPPVDENERAGRRLSGVLRAFGEAGIASTDAWRTQTLYSVAAAKAATLDLFGRSGVPSALICGNDIIAQGALFAAQRLGLRVPEDLSVVGIGDFPGSADLEPGLTTVRIPARRIGQEAGRYLVHAIQSPDSITTLRHECPVELRIRGTTRHVVA